MTTEVQITNSRIHSAYLRKVISCICAQIGMGGMEIEETQSAVNKLCLGTSSRMHDGSPKTLSVRISSHETFMTVDITDHLTHINLSNGEWFISNEYMRRLEVISGLADAIEVSDSEDGITVRITKYARRPQMNPSHFHSDILSASSLPA